jgi:hypothetical protein
MEFIRRNILRMESDEEVAHRKCIESVNDYVRFSCLDEPTTKRKATISCEESVPSDILFAVVFNSINSRIACKGKKLNEINEFIRQQLPICGGKIYIIVSSTVFLIEEISGPITLFWASSVKSWNKNKEEAVFSPCPCVLAWNDDNCRSGKSLAVLCKGIVRDVAICKKSNVKRKDTIIGSTFCYYRWLNPAYATTSFRTYVDVTTRFPVKIKEQQRKYARKMGIQRVAASLTKERTALDLHHLALGCDVDSDHSFHGSDFSNAITEDAAHSVLDEIDIRYVQDRSMDSAIAGMKQMYIGGDDSSDASQNRFSYTDERQVAASACDFDTDSDLSHMEVRMSESNTSIVPEKQEEPEIDDLEALVNLGLAGEGKDGSQTARVVGSGASSEAEDDEEDASL